MTITREQAKELLPIIQALVEGKAIQDKIEGLTDWVDTDEINLEYEGQKIKHRIKPEPKYRPFKTKKECWEEMQKHQPFGWIKNKKEKDYYNIVNISQNSETPEVTINVFPYSFTALFTSFTFIDGSPFGVKEE